MHELVLVEESQSIQDLSGHGCKQWLILVSAANNKRVCQLQKCHPWLMTVGMASRQAAPAAHERGCGKSEAFCNWCQVTLQTCNETWQQPHDELHPVSIMVPLTLLQTESGCPFDMKLLMDRQGHNQAQLHGNTCQALLQE